MTGENELGRVVSTPKPAQLQTFHHKQWSYTKTTAVTFFYHFQYLKYWQVAVFVGKWLTLVYPIPADTSTFMLLRYGSQSRKFNLFLPWDNIHCSWNLNHSHNTHTCTFDICRLQVTSHVANQNKSNNRYQYQYRYTATQSEKQGYGRARTLPQTRSHTNQ